MTISTSLFQAISFAAYQHRAQIRKDGKTPYTAHPFRVMMVVRHIFQIDDEDILIAAVLHDTIEDTEATFDEIKGMFGQRVAEWTILLTREERPGRVQSREDYYQQLIASPEEVKWIKLADIYDNVNDSAHLAPERRARTLKRSQDYLDIVFSNPTHPTTIHAKAIVEMAIRGA